jgi:hypothetical protein
MTHTQKCAVYLHDQVHAELLTLVCRFARTYAPGQLYLL